MLLAQELDFLWPKNEQKWKGRKGVKCHTSHSRWQCFICNCKLCLTSKSAQLHLPTDATHHHLPRNHHRPSPPAPPAPPTPAHSLPSRPNSQPSFELSLSFSAKWPKIKNRRRFLWVKRRMVVRIPKIQPSLPLPPPIPLLVRSDSISALHSFLFQIYGSNAWHCVPSYYNFQIVLPCSICSQIN